MSIRQNVLAVFVSLCICNILCYCAGNPVYGQAYCNIVDVKHSALANGVQIIVKSDGILIWNWEKNSEAAGSGTEMTEVSIRFQSAQIAVAKTQFDIDQDPVSNASLMIPQDITDGRGVVLRVMMSSPSVVQASLSEDRQTFILIVEGKRTIERITRNAAAGSVKEGNALVTADNGLISVRAMKANIHSVVAEIAQVGGLSVAVDDAVCQEVSINLLNRKPLDVLRSIAAGYGLALSSVGDVYMLSGGVPADISTYQRSGTTSFPLRFLKAKDARSLLPNFLSKYVHDNPEQNAVVVTAPSQMLEKIGQNLRTIDVPPPMIMVECAVVELTDSSDLDKEFRWQYTDTAFTAGTDSSTGKITYNQVNPQDGMVSTVVPTPKLQAWLKGLITKERAVVQAHPSMAAVNGKNAEIFIGSQRFIKVQNSNNGTVTYRLETIPVGVRLQIMPWTGGNNEVSTWLQVEVSNIAQIDPQSGVPRLGTRRASTTMRTHDGDTIVIGGLSLKQDEVTNRRIPLISRLPLIGSLFRGKATSASHTELVLLVRPRLLGVSGDLPASEGSDIRKRFLQPGELGYQEKVLTPK